LSQSCRNNHELRGPFDLLQVHYGQASVFSILKIVTVL
jgi:hypothetical protein